MFSCHNVWNLEEQRVTILVVIFLDNLMFDKIFVSPQVKRIVVISNKHGIYELPHELPNDLRLRNLGNSEISRRSQNFRIIAWCSVLLTNLKFCLEGREKATNKRNFYGRHKKLPKELTTELLYPELPTISASCGVKR